jgi:zinc/manganese transport system substrate-binding protein
MAEKYSGVGTRSENQYHFVMVRIAAALAAALVIGAAGCSPGTKPGTGLPVIVATTSQTADFVRVIGGDAVTVYSVVKPGVDPHEYEPTPADLTTIRTAAVVVTNGVGLEPWLAKVKAASPPTGAVVVASDGVLLRPGDPHIWHNPANAKIMVTSIASALSKALPDKSATFTTNLTAYVAQLDQLDTDITAQVASLTNRKLVTNHDAFGYLTDRYGFEFVGAVIPSFDTATELSTADVQVLVKKIRALGVKAVFSESSLPPKTAQAVATEAGVKVITGDDALYGDSLGPAGSDGDTYLKMMRHNVRTIVTALA